jgi:putative transposase
MSETLDPLATAVDQQELARQLLAQAKEQASSSWGPAGC